MDFWTKLILALVVVDAVLIARFHLWLRSNPPTDEKTFRASRVGLFMFGVHAVLCFEGVFMTIQLAAIAALYTLASLHHAGKISKTSVVAAK